MNARFFALFSLTGCLSVALPQVSSLSCTAAAVPTVVRSEGLTERMGDIVLNCSRGLSGGTVNANLTIFLSVNVTNRISANNVTDVSLTVDTGSAPAPALVSATLVGANSVTFNGLSFTLPPSGEATFRISNLRGAANQAGLAGGVPILAFLASNGASSLNVSNGALTVGVAARGLLAGSSTSSVACKGSPLPATLDLASLFAAGTGFFSTRVTEGSAGAFEKKAPETDSGVRIVVRYSGFPAESRLFTPTVVAGSNAVEPTAGGDLGLPASGGRYAPGGTGSLLLVRVLGADQAGGGGTLAYTPGPPGSGTVSFNTVTEVTLVDGTGQAVFEVVDADASVRESAQFPTFLGLPPVTGGKTVVAGRSVSLGPISNVALARVADPVPRFVKADPPLDCTALMDCDASYFPRLFVESEPLEFTAQTGSFFQIKYIRILNRGGGQLLWTAKVTYRTGSDWVRLYPESAINNATLRLDVHPEELSPDRYEATLTIDAGPLAGTRSLPIVLTVTPAPPAPEPIPVVETAKNPAAAVAGPVVPGSLAVLKGSRFSGASVAVTVDGLPARLLSRGETEIILEVPPKLLGLTAAQLVVTVDGISSAPLIVPLADVAPAIFANGILNQNNTVNGTDNVAPVGSVVQIFATGLPLPAAGTISARVHDRDILMPDYGGPAPGWIGLQQVNINIPVDLPAMTTEVSVCGSSDSIPAERVCSPPAPITLR